MRRCVCLMLSLVAGMAWVAAAAEEPDVFRPLKQVYHLGQDALQGQAPGVPYDPAYAAPGYGPGWGQPAWSGQPDSGAWGQAPSPPAIAVTADLVTMERVGGRPATLISTIGAGTELLNVTDLDFSFAPGARLNCLWYGKYGWDLEVGYFGIDGWNAAEYRLVTGGGIQFVAPGFVQQVATAGDALRFDYFSRLYTVEANLRNRVGDRLTLLGGFRWARFAERLEGSIFTPPPVDATTGFWENTVDNRLYGFQVGGEYLVFNGEQLRVGAVAKGGIFGNHAIQDTTGPLVGGFASAAGNNGAFLGEASVNALWQADQHTAWRFGYQAMWLDGVALSPAQIHVTNLATSKARADAAGTAFFHGAILGLEVKF